MKFYESHRSMKESRLETMLEGRQCMQEDIRCVRYKLGWKPDVQDQHGSRMLRPHVSG